MNKYTNPIHTANCYEFDLFRGGREQETGNLIIHYETCLQHIRDINPFKSMIAVTIHIFVHDSLN